MKLIILLFSMLMTTVAVQATPSSLFWTNCTTSIQQEKTCNNNFDNYFALGYRKTNPYFPPNLGVEFGLFSFDKISAEAGFDFLCGVKDPWYFNAKIGLSEEDVLFKGCPSMNIGIFDVGTKKGRTDYNIVDFIVGKTIPYLDVSLCAGYFTGKRTMGKNKQGVMVSLAKPFFHTTYHDGREYDRLIFLADYASGKNIIGGGGFALSYFFTPTIDIITGPVWFNDRKLNGKWKWSIQIDIGLDFRDFS